MFKLLYAHINDLAQPPISLGLALRLWGSVPVSYNECISTWTWNVEEFSVL